MRSEGTFGPSTATLGIRDPPSEPLDYSTRMHDCFVVMPIGIGDAYQVHLNRYEHIIHPAVEGLKDGEQQLFRCIRADFVAKSGSITKDLIGRLYRSRVVIADLTDLNPNVFYELGVRHALRLGTILVALKGTKPPFDVGDLRVIPYEDRVGGEKEAIPQIQAMLRSVLAEEQLDDSPVLAALPELAQLLPAKEHEARISALTQERDFLRGQLEVLESTTLTNQATLAAMNEVLNHISRQLGEGGGQKTVQAIAEFVQSRTEETASVRRSTRRTAAASDPKLVFVLMPFAQELQPVFEAVSEAATKYGLRAYRADSVVAAGSIIDQIYDAITGAGLIVADLTGGNQNVMYELGLAKAMNKKTLLLSQDVSSLPFDIAHQRVLSYSLTPHGFRDLQHGLSEFFQSQAREADA